MYIDILSSVCQYKCSWQTKKLYRIVSVLFSYISFSMVRKNSGFTMVELMIVIAIIGILAVTLIPAFSGMQNRAKDTGIVNQVEGASLALEAWKTDTNSNFPTNWKNADGSLWAADPNALRAYANAQNFSSLAPTKVCNTAGPADASTVNGITVGVAGCGTQWSYGYVPARLWTTTAGTYLIWARLNTATKGNLKSAVAPLTMTTNGTATTAIVNAPGVGGATINGAGFYAVHGGNKWTAN